MFTSITKSIEDSRMLIDLENQSMISNAKVVKDPYIAEFGEAQTQTFKAGFSLTKFPDLPKQTSWEYWKNLVFGSKKGEAELEITTIPVADGRTSYAFKIYDKTRGMNMIGKIDKDVYNGEYMKDRDTAYDRLNTQRYSI